MITTEYSIGPFKRVLLLGGGKLLVLLSRWAAANGFSVGVITSPRHAEEDIDGLSLVRVLTDLRLEHTVAESLDAALLERVLPQPQDTFALSLGAAWIFSEKLIREGFRGNLFNLHGTRLPQNRGGGGFSWQILTGNRFGFCNIHRMMPGIDQGEIVFSREFLYPASCRTPKHYADLYAEKTFEFVVQLLGELRGTAKIVEPVSQPEYLSSYWPRLSTDINGWIDWRWSALQLERFICAFDDPYVGAQTLWNDRRIFLKKASSNLQDGQFHPYQAGIVYRKTPQWLCVSVEGASLVIEEAFDEANASLLSQIKVGDRFHTPARLLDDARRRVVYSPKGLKE